MIPVHYKIFLVCLLMVVISVITFVSLSSANKQNQTNKNKIKPLGVVLPTVQSISNEIVKKHGELDLSSFETDLNELSEIEVQLFSDESNMAFRKKKNTEKGLFYEDDVHGNAMNIINKNGKFYGSITFDDKVYSVTTLPNGSTIVDEIMDQDFPPEDAPHDVERFLSTEPSSSLRRWVTPEERELEELDSGDIIDIMCIYTKHAMCAEAGYRTEDGDPTNTCADSPENREPMDNRCQLAVEETNFAYTNSGVETQMRLVYSGMVDYEDLSPSGVENLLYQITISDDDIMDIVHTWREQYRADLVALITENRYYCGLAWPFSNNPAAGFSVSHRRCMTGYFTFAHETGHNMGCTHDRHTKRQTDTVSYPNYNYGFRDPEGRFRTIMAYDCPGCPKKQRFSNSKLTIDYDGKQEAIGSQDEDCAKRMNDVRTQVANYRKSLPAPEAVISSPEPISLGCFADDKESRALEVFVGKDMDFDSCRKACTNLGTSHFGRQGMGECWCGGNSYAKHGQAEGCDCDANNIGTEKFCAYELDHFEGCYNDASDRALHHFVGKGLSMRKCKKACKKFGYHFMGRQGHQECWCGGSSPADTSYAVYGPSDECNCKSSDNLGAGVNCVYRIFFATFRGCWKDDEDRTLSFNAGKKMSFDECHEECQSRGYHFMGRQGWEECWCGGASSRDVTYKTHGREYGCACDSKFIGSWKMCVNRVPHRN